MRSPQRGAEPEPTWLPDPTAESAVPLRDSDEWEPRRILGLLGPALAPEQRLSKLLVACCVLEGPPRFLELATRLEHLAQGARARLAQMAADPTLEPRREEIGALASAMLSVARSVPRSRARAANEVRGLTPNRLEAYDLELLAACAQQVIAASEAAAMRNPIGVDRALAFARSEPSLGFARAWVRKLLPGLSRRGISLAEEGPPRRVVALYPDGRIAYDPEPVEEFDDG